MEEFLKHWHFVRSESLEILRSLSDEQLQFKPEGEKWQPLYYQFACMGRTQLVYAKAAKAGTLNFADFGSSDLPSKHEFQTVEKLSSFLEGCDKEWQDALIINQDGIDWPDGKKSTPMHIESLAEHERLHHGQLISYFTLAHIDLPSGFKNNWAL